MRFRARFGARSRLTHNGFESLYPRYAGGRPPTFTLAQRQQIKKIALSRPQDHGLPFSTWSLTKLAEFVVAEGVVDDISHEGLRDLLGKEGVSFQVIKTFKQSNDPDYEAKKNRVLELYDIADGKAEPAGLFASVVVVMSASNFENRDRTRGAVGCSEDDLAGPDLRRVQMDRTAGSDDAGCTGWAVELADLVPQRMVRVVASRHAGCGSGRPALR